MDKAAWRIRRGRWGLRRRSGGFTLIEVLVAVLLVGVALVAVLNGIRAVSGAGVRARDADLLQRLAAQKVQELATVTDPDTAEDSGDFTDQGYPDIEWTLAVEPSGAENLDQITVTARRGNTEQSLTTLIFVRPVTDNAAASGGTGAAGGSTGTP